MSHRRLIFLLSIALIFSMGMLMVFDTSSADVLDKGKGISTHAAVIKHGCYAVFGIALALLVFVLGCENWLRLSPLLAIGTILLLLLVFVPGLGAVRHGARRWIAVGPLSFQPSELAKFTLPLYCIHSLSSYRGDWRRAWKGFALVSAIIVLVLIEPDKGTAAILGMCAVSALVVARIKARYWLLPMVALAAIGCIAAFTSPYAMRRIMVYLHPEADVLGSGHQPYQARIAAGSGGLLGKGAGLSLQKFSYLPEAQNDYIAAIFAEEFGYIGVLTLILLYLLFTASSLSIAHSANTKEGLQLAAVCTFLIAIQGFFNLGVVSGIVPTTGLNLPFFSQGGTSLVTNMMTAALILSTEKWQISKSSLPPVEPVAI